MKTETRFNRQSGTAIVEYSVVSVMVVTVLFVPIPWLGTSIFHFILDAFRQFQAHTTVLLSMP